MKKMSTSDNLNGKKNFETISAIPNDAYFIQKLLSMRDSESRVYASMYGTESLEFVTGNEIAKITNVTLAVSRKFEEGRKCSGILCFIDEKVDRKKSFVCLNRNFKLDPNVVLRLLIASPNRAIALQKDSESGEIAITGFVNVNECRRSLIFQIHDRRGTSVSYGGEIIAAITPESILTSNHASGQSATCENREYLIRRALLRVTTKRLRSLSDLIRFDWKIRCFSWMFRRVWEHGHGGCLIISPNSGRALHHVESKFEFSEQSSIQTVLYAYRDCMKSFFVMEKAKEGTDISKQLKANTKFLVSERALRNNLEWVGDLSRVDGAVMMGHDMRLRSFGAKVTRLDPELEVLILDCIGVQESRKARVSSLGGTRHQSAASLVALADNSFAFVASQDGSATFLLKRKGEPLCVFINFQYLFELQAPTNLVNGDFAYTEERPVDLKHAL